MNSIDLGSMNETDVREVIVRPFLHRLGYAHGTRAHIRTEVPLRYSSVFLGRKDPKRDPDLRGRADYVCEVISFGRWVVEVKSPQRDLDVDDAHQAFTYAAHPEIAAYWFIVTNGGDFRLYNIRSADIPVMQWRLDELDQKFEIIEGLLGPDAIERAARREAVDLRKPLARGLASRARIVGGFLTYDEHRSKNPLMGPHFNTIKGARASVTGQHVGRTDQGRIGAYLTLVGPHREWDELNAIGGIFGYEFETSDEHVSVDPNQPNIFQGVTVGHIPRGAVLKIRPTAPVITMPFGVNMSAYTEAVGFYEDGRFKGTFYIFYNFAVSEEDKEQPQAAVYENVMRAAEIQALGDFDLAIEPGL